MRTEVQADYVITPSTMFYYRWVFAKLSNTNYTRIILELGPVCEDYVKTDQDIWNGVTGSSKMYPIVSVLKGKKYFKFSSGVTHVPARMDEAKSLRAIVYLQSLIEVFSIICVVSH